MNVIVTGKTFEHRDLLKSLHGSFDPEIRGWHIENISELQVAKLKNSVGLIVVINDTKPEPVFIIDDDYDFIPFTTSKVYGDDCSYHNHFAQQNPAAFFGFSSLSAMIDHIAHIADDNRRGPGWDKGQAKFAGTDTMQEAIELARQGWLEGAEMMQEIVDRLALANPRIKRRAASIAGGTVNIGRLLANNPAHMVKRPKLPGRKIVTLFIECGFNANIEIETAMIRACIIAAISDIMENQGYSCTIVAVDTSIEGGNRAYYQLCVTIKEAGERLNISDAIFAMGHPAFLRRFSFALCSSVPETKRIWISQGSPCNAFNDDHPCRSNEFYIPCITTNDLTLDLIIPKNLPIKIEGKL